MKKQKEKDISLTREDAFTISVYELKRFLVENDGAFYPRVSKSVSEEENQLGRFLDNLRYNYKDIPEDEESRFFHIKKYEFMNQNFPLWDNPVAFRNRLTEKSVKKDSNTLILNRIFLDIKNKTPYVEDYYDLLLHDLNKDLCDELVSDEERADLIPHTLTPKEAIALIKNPSNFRSLRKNRGSKIEELISHLSLEDHHHHQQPESV